MIGFWCLKQVSGAFSVRLLESAGEKCVFICISAASESEFDHANRIPCLKAGLLVYKVSRLSKCQGYLSIAHLFQGRFARRFDRCCETNFTTCCS